MTHWSPDRGSLDLATIRQQYQIGRVTPPDMMTILFERIRASAHRNVFITLFEEAAVQARAREVQQRARERGLASLPLLGVPFVVKDNIDVAGVPTTAACRGFAYTPDKSAPVVEKLLAAGAILLGKTNLDQFATGLAGVVSSYGPTSNPFNPEFISGGSSSGTAVAVAAGFASFGLGTDTAGSGRVPAAFTNLVGLKPTRGVISTRGIVPACRSLDCVAIFSNNVDDAAEVLTLTKGFDTSEAYSRRDANDLDLSVIQFPVGHFRYGVPRPEQLEFYGDADAENLYHRALQRLESIGGRRVEIDASAFLAAGKLLYGGPWVAERLAAIEDFYAEHAHAIDPVIYKIMGRAEGFSSVQVFKALYRLRELKRQAESQWALMDLLAIPTTGTIFRSDEAIADPAATSAKLGLYTNFVNLLDLTAIALPAGFRRDGLPLGITLCAQALAEPNLVAIAQRFATNRYGGVLGASVHADLVSQDIDDSTLTYQAAQDRTSICVVGAHLSGQPLNYQLRELDGMLVRQCKTAPLYRLYALPGATPPKPGLTHMGPSGGGAAIEVEVWSIPTASVGAFMARVPAPLTIGTITLDNGECVKGFLCEHYVLAQAADISQYGGWIAYMHARQTLATAQQ